MKITWKRYIKAILVIIFILLAWMLLGNIIVKNIVNTFYSPFNEARYVAEKNVEASCNGYHEIALSIARKFCEKMNIQCGDAVSEISYQPTYLLSGIGIHNREPKGAITINFRDSGDNEEPLVQPYIPFAVGCQSGEVEIYSNQSIVSHRNRQVKEFDSEGRVQYEFMSEEKANEIVNNIAMKIGMPDDMKFDRLEKNTFAGVWNAFWYHEKDGYRYEGDVISISITGSTGEFIAYHKVYLGKPCPINIQVSEDKALNIAWNEFQKHISNKVRNMYETRTKLVISRADIFTGTDIPMPWDNSRLVWRIVFVFNGGMQRPELVRNDDGILTDASRKVKIKYNDMLFEIWRKNWKPLRDYEVKIDAENGEIVYKPIILPRCLAVYYK